jgi:nucleotide-binding universal stress UspA family protein
MFKRILVAYDGSPESGRALIAGIQLAQTLKSELRTVYVYEKLPPYAAGYMDFSKEMKCRRLWNACKGLGAIFWYWVYLGAVGYSAAFGTTRLTIFHNEWPAAF